LAKCGACGSSYVKISKNLFGCAAARNRGTCDNRLNIRLDTLEETVLSGLRKRLMAPELFKAFCEEFHRELNRQRIEDTAQADSKRLELAQVERRIRRIVELITEDDAPARALKQELTTLEARQDTLQRELAETTAPAPLLHPNLAEVYRQQVEQLHHALHDPATRDEPYLVGHRSDIIWHASSRFKPIDGSSHPRPPLPCGRRSYNLRCRCTRVRHSRHGEGRPLVRAQLHCQRTGAAHDDRPFSDLVGDGGS